MAMVLCMRVPALRAAWKKRKLRKRLMTITLPLKMAYVYSHLRQQVCLCQGCILGGV